MKETLCNPCVTFVVFYMYSIIVMTEAVPVHNYTSPYNTSENWDTDTLNSSSTEATTQKSKSSLEQNGGVASSTTESVWTNYDQVGAMQFIVITVVLYSLVGTLTLLLLRMCRSAQRIHKKTDLSDEMVEKYLRLSLELQNQGDRDQKLIQKKRTCMTLISIEEQRSKSSTSQDGGSTLSGDENDVFIPPKDIVLPRLSTVDLNNSSGVNGGVPNLDSRQGNGSAKLENGFENCENSDRTHDQMRQLLSVSDGDQDEGKL